ncbi:MAG TPA: hybrid sensor histidine kinase/response regulator [Minicystis sp.]|nr:hybrid sensor histidine kinase/response regulator [Minicystis sp.]
MRLLLVDDEPANLDVMERMLRRLGHEIERAADGRAGLAAFAARRPDLVLLDMMMPDMDGLEVLEKLKAAPGGDAVPVVLVTAHHDREHRIAGLEAGADDFIEKPLDSALLVARVRTLLRLKAARDELAARHAEVVERHAALERLQREQRELTEFIVHDLKSPLAVVCANLAWVLGEIGTDAPDLVDALDDANAAAGRLRRMIEDLLAVSRLEQSTFPLSVESLDVPPLLDEVASSAKRRASERGVSVETRAAGALHARADAALLRRVLENIVDNSLRYTPRAGRVALEVSGDGWVTISVSNSGPAIPARDRARVFEKFARGELEAAGRGNAGLGLYFCKRAVQALGGDIRVDETPEWPTSFVITLPAA